jgi:hypothetical protein
LVRRIQVASGQIQVAEFGRMAACLRIEKIEKLLGETLANKGGPREQNETRAAEIAAHQTSVSLTSECSW